MDPPGASDAAPLPALASPRAHASSAFMAQTKAAASNGLPLRRSPRKQLRGGNRDSGAETERAMANTLVRHTLRAADDPGRIANLAQKTAKSLLMEAWLDGALAPGQHLRSATMSGAPAVPSSVVPSEVDEGLRSHNLTRAQLAQLGVTGEAAESIYRSIFVHSVGFQDAVRKAAASAAKPKAVVGAAWRAFVKVTEGAVGRAYHTPRHFFDGVDDDDDMHLALASEPDGLGTDEALAPAKAELLAEARAENEELLDSNERLRARVRDLESAVQELNEQRAVVEQRAERSASRYAAEVRLRTEMQTREHDAMAAAELARASEVKALEELGTLRASQASIEATFGESHAMIEELKAELMASETRLAAEKEQLQMITKRLETTEKQRDSFAQNVAEGFRMTMDSKAAVREATEEKTAVILELEDAKEATKRTQLELELKDASEKSLMSQIREMEQANMLLRKQRESSFRSHVEAKGELQMCEARLAQRTEEVEQAHDKISTLNENIEALNDDLNAANSREADAKELEEALRMELIRMNNRVHGLGVVAATVHGNGSRISAENQLFRKRIEALLRERDAMRSSLDSNGSQIEDVLRQLEEASESIGELRERNSQLTADNVVLRADNEKLITKYEHTATELGEALSKVDDLEWQLEEKTQALDLSDVENGRLAAENKRIGASNTQLQYELDHVSAEVAESLFVDDIVGGTVEESLREQLARTEEENKRLDIEIKMATGSMENMVQWKAENEPKLKELHAKTESLHAETLALKAELVHVQLENDSMSAKATARLVRDMVAGAITKAKSEEQDAERVALKGQLSESEQNFYDRINVQARELSDLKERHETTLSDYERLAAQMNALSADHDALGSERDDMASRLADALTKVEMLEGSSQELADSKSGMVVLQQRLDEMNEKYASLSASYQAEHEASAKQEKEFEELIAKLKSQLKEQRAACEMELFEQEKETEQRVHAFEAQFNEERARNKEHSQTRGREWKIIHKEDRELLKAWQARAHSLASALGMQDAGVVGKDAKQLPPTRLTGDALLHGMHNTSWNDPVNESVAALGGSWIAALPATFAAAAKDGEAGRIPGYAFQPMPLPFVPFTRDALESIVLAMYLSKLSEDAAADRGVHHSAPSTFKAFVHEYFISRFGERAVGEHVLFCLSKEAVRLAPASKRLRLFCSFCGLRTDGNGANEVGGESLPTQLTAHAAFFVLEFLGQLIGSKVSHPASTYTLHAALDALARMAESRSRQPAAAAAAEAGEAFRSLMGDRATEATIPLDELLFAAARLETRLEDAALQRMGDVYANAVGASDDEDNNDSSFAVGASSYDRIASLVRTLPGYRERCGLDASNEAEAPPLPDREARQLFRTALLLSGNSGAGMPAAVSPQGFAVACALHGMSDAALQLYEPPANESLSQSPALGRGDWLMLGDVWTAFKAEIGAILGRPSNAALLDEDDSRVSATATVSEQLKRERCIELRDGLRDLSYMIDNRKGIPQAWKMLKRVVGMYRIFLNLERQEATDDVFAL